MVASPDRLDPQDIIRQISHEKGIRPVGQSADTSTAAAAFGQPVAVGPEETWHKRLTDDRGISPRVIDEMGIQADDRGRGWLYYGGRRGKAYDSSADTKYWWEGGKPDGATYWHADDFPAAVEAGGFGDCWIATEFDLLALLSAGIRHAFAVFGEHAPAGLARFLDAHGVKRLLVAPDRDDAGARFADALAERLAGSPVELVVKQLPADLGSKGDLGRLWKRERHLGGAFERYLLTLPNVTPKPPAESPTARPLPDISAYDDGEGLAALARAVGAALGLDENDYNSKGWSTKPVASPFRDDRKPSFLWCLDGCGKDRATEETYNAKQTAAAVGIDWRPYLDFRATTAPTSSRAMLATETREALIQQGLTAVARLLDTLYAAGATSGGAFTARHALDASQGIAQKTVYAALKAEAGNGQVFFSPVATPSSFALAQYGVPNGEKNKSGRGRPPKYYRLPGPDAVAAALGVDLDGAHHDAMPAAALADSADYRARVYAALPARKPGQYSRRFLAARLGVSASTTRRYDERAGLAVRPRFKRTEITDKHMGLYTADRRDKPGNEWLEVGGVFWRDNQPRRYAPTETGLKMAIAKAAEIDKETGESKGYGPVYRVIQQSNHYGPPLRVSTFKDDAVADVRRAMLPASREAA